MKIRSYCIFLLKSSHWIFKIEVSFLDHKVNLIKKAIVSIKLTYCGKSHCFNHKKNYIKFLIKRLQHDFNSCSSETSQTLSTKQLNYWLKALRLMVLKGGENCFFFRNAIETLNITKVYHKIQVYCICSF